MTDKQYKIMVVEDESLLLQAISKKLEKNGFVTVTCSGGQQALDYLENMDEMPDALWLDYYLKDTNGLELMQKIKAHDKWSKIPVLIVSNSASPEKVKSLLALGAKRYFLKAEKRLDEIIGEVRSLIDEQ